MDPSWHMTLPKFAQLAMFKFYSPTEPYCYSFWKPQADLRELVRKNLTGGLVNCFHRLVDLSGRPGMPHAAQFAPNGDKFTSLMFFDFNRIVILHFFIFIIFIKIKLSRSRNL